LAIDVEAAYRQFGPMVVRRCRKMLGSEEAAVDAAQDTFVRLMEYRERLSEQALCSLLYRMATNVCLNRLRSQRRRPADPDGELIGRIADARLPEDRFLSMSVLQRLFAGHRDSTRTIAVLHLVDGMTLQEVADEVGLSVSGVRKRLAPLREQLAQLEREEVNP